MADQIGEELVATYEVNIVGVQRSKNQLATLTREIQSLRAGDYGRGTSATAASKANAEEVFTASIEKLEGRIQKRAQDAMIKGMNLGRTIQIETLRAAVTPTGESGKSLVGGRNGPGRDDSGEIIKDLKRNVEIGRTPTVTFVTGYHGWTSDGGHAGFQERGTKGRGGGTASEQREGGKVFRRKNKAKKRTSGTKYSKGAGVPAANSLGAAIVPVRELLKTEIGALKK